MKAEKTNKAPRFIKLKEVERLTALSSTEIYRRIAKGQFPKQIKIGEKSVVWIEQEIHAWIDLMIAGRDEE